ncbi:hypothetical protein SPRG_19023 [Saprolegnia parasitica CBS 223.65]|uniref:GRIP domain-containing protein n=1 Tax=Saprolegnia parasitica (strain CBS 223.65) TaxID=695850 RepID=A0A067CUM2_SAPPC|nr:hypothetical protein SPRG_19023 [Saprolegnia parasitica CBS 223.65]KDO34173.1 hypothetical protein SPRG_19023 [Saprolegnia parasitica CBS 223.65]|eukprot:XP_012195222.1 hypothetical protein SPRG_19023 [Saprolegnia parasitica CBS 223.65]
MKKKEQLEKGLAEMKELGMGGLTKGLSFLRQKSSSYGHLDEEKPPLPTGRTSSFSTMADKPKMSYDELLSLSMKLTKQNRSIKSQMTTASDKLFRLTEVEANYNALVAFVTDDIGLDIAFEPSTEVDDAQVATEAASTDAPPLDAEKVLDTTAMRQQYHSRDAAREQHVREMETLYVQEIASLKAQLEQLRPASPQDEVSSSEAVVSSDATLRFELETLKSSLAMERRLRDEADKTWQSKLSESEAAKRSLQDALAKAQATATSLATQLAAAETTASSYAADIQAQITANAQREETLSALKRELQNQTQWTQTIDALELNLQQKGADMDMLSQSVVRLEAEVAAKSTELATISAKLATAERERSQLQDLADTAMAKHTHLEAELRDFQGVANAKSQLEAESTSLRAELASAVAAVLADARKNWSEQNALATRLAAENQQYAETCAGHAAEVAQLQQQLAQLKSRFNALSDELAEAKSLLQTQTLEFKDALTSSMHEVATLQAQVATQETAFHDMQASLTASAAANLQALQAAHAAEVDRLESDARAKSKLARQLVLEKEEQVASLSAQLTQLEHDVKSGDADHRRIFELANVQAQRDAVQRSRDFEVAELTNAVAAKQAEIESLKAQIKVMEDEIAVLVRTERREGVNMEYLKNVVVQFMSFRPGSSQQAKLIPVLSTLLQFSPHDVDEVRAATKRSTAWTSWGVEKKPIKTLVPPPAILIPRTKGPRPGSPGGSEPPLEPARQGKVPETQRDAPYATTPQ